MGLQTLHEPVVIAQCLLVACSEFDGSVIHTGIWYKLYYILLQKWSPQQHYCSTVHTLVHTQNTTPVQVITSFFRYFLQYATVYIDLGLLREALSNLFYND